MTTTTTKETEYSTLREAIFKHRFVYEFLEYCWKKEKFNAEVLQNSIDNSGYDLIILIGNRVNYIQLKVTAQDSATKSFPIHKRLVSKEPAFILLTEYDRLDLKNASYYFLKIDNQLWESSKRSKKENVRHIKRTLLTGLNNPKAFIPLEMSQIFSAFEG